MNCWTQSPRNIFVAGHMGWAAKYPENTMASFEAAAALGVDQIEMDVHCTADGSLVLIHDDTVERTTTGTGAIAQMTLAEVRTLDAGVKKDARFAGERIPMWEELLELAGRYPSLTLDVELKEYPTPGNEERAYSTCDRVIADLDARGMTDRVVLNSFSGKMHEYIRDKYGARIRRHVYYPVSYLGEITKEAFDTAYCCCMCSETPGECTSDAEKFAAVTARGIQPWAPASVRDAATVDVAIARGAYLITCNNPDEILTLLRERGYHR